MATYHLSGNGNAIIKPATPDRLKDGSPACGFDQHGQLWVRRQDTDDCVTGTIIRDARSYRCPICQRGWENTTESLLDQQWIHDMNRLAHKTCMDGYGHLSNFFFWHNLVCEKPMNAEGLEFVEKPNEYGSTWTGPWYQVTFNHLKEFPMIVGARKRVFFVEIANVPKELADVFEKAFEKEKEEKITMGASNENNTPTWLIHAWGRQKAEEYLRKIVEILVAWKKEVNSDSVLSVQT